MSDKLACLPSSGVRSEKSDSSSKKSEVETPLSVPVSVSEEKHAADAGDNTDTLPVPLVTKAIPSQRKRWKAKLSTSEIGILVERRALLSLQFPQLITAWTEVHGVINHYGRKNKKKLLAFAGFVISLLFEGKPALSRWTHEWRTRSLSCVKHARTVNLFGASTLARAINWPVTKEQLKDAEAVITKLWHRPAPIVSEATKKRITRSIKRMLGSIDKTIDPIAKIPSGNSCMEVTKKKGGTRAALKAEWDRRSVLTPTPNHNLEHGERFQRIGTAWETTGDLLDSEVATKYPEELQTARKQVKERLGQMYDVTWNRLKSAHRTSTVERLPQDERSARPKPVTTSSWSKFGVQSSLSLFSARNRQASNNPMFRPLEARDTPISAQVDKSPLADLPAHLPRQRSDQELPTQDERRAKIVEDVRLAILARDATATLVETLRSRSRDKHYQQRRPMYPPPPSEEVIYKRPYLEAAEYTPSTLMLMCLTTERENPKSLVRAVAIPEKGGKIRVASLHPATEVHLARLIMSRHIPVLKRMGITRDVLRNKQTQITTNKEDAELYSADLSKATEHIGHEVAQHVWTKWCQELNEPNWVIEAGCQILGPKVTPDGRKTTRGLHMGLGITWIVLSVLNIHCAIDAGINLPSFNVCGDDLIALCSPRQRANYVQSLDRVGLVANVTKEFYTTNGTFCERLMVRDGSQSAHSIDIPKISALGATKYLGRFTLDRIATLVGLPKGNTRSTKWLEAKTRSKLAVHTSKTGVRLSSGPVTFGGSGEHSQPSLKNMVVTLVRGKIQMDPRLSKLSKEIRDKHTVTRQTQSNTVTFEQLRLNEFRILAFHSLLPAADTLTLKKFIPKASHYNKGKRETRRTVLQAICKSRLTHQNKKRLRRKLNSGISIHNPRFKKLLFRLINLQQKEYVMGISKDDLQLREKQSKIILSLAKIPAGAKTHT